MTFYGDVFLLAFCDITFWYQCRENTVLSLSGSLALTMKPSGYRLSCINPNLGRLFRGLFWYGGGVKFPLLNLKLKRVMLATSKLARKYTFICKFIPISAKTLLNLLLPAFFGKKIALCNRSSNFTLNNSVRAVLKIFQFL